MAGLTTVDARHRLIEAVAVKFGQGHLLDFGDLEKSEGTEFKGHVLHDADPFVPLSGHLAKFVLNILGARAESF